MKVLLRILPLLLPRTPLLVLLVLLVLVSPLHWVVLQYLLQVVL